MHRVPRAWPVGLLTLALALGACGGDTAGSPSNGGDGGSSAAPDESSPDGDGEATRFSVVSLTFDLAELPFLAALDEMRADGYSIDYIQMTAAAEIGVEGVSNGRFQFGGGAFPGWAVGVQQGADVEIITQRRLNDWQVYGLRDIESCEDLGGRTVAIHSESSISAAMLRDWVDTECPGTEPNYVIIAGSENRYAAMIAGEVDASPVELVDALHLEDEAGDRFHQLTSFSESLPDLAATVQAVNKSWADENPGVVRDLIAALLEQHRLVAADPNYLYELADRYPESVSEPPTQTAVERYAALFPVNGGLTEDILEYTIGFFTNTEHLEEGVTPADIADLSYQEAALELIGEE